MRILIVIPRQPRDSGNHVSAARYAAGLQRYGHLLHLVEAAAGESLEPEATAFAPDLVLLLHAWRSGGPWLATTHAATTPRVVILTGTDVNHDLLQPERTPVCRAVLDGAAAILTQNCLTLQRLGRDYPAWRSRLHHLPPGITLGTTPYPLRRRHGLPEEGIVFLQPAGLRPVKGNLELLHAFAPVARQRPQALLAFCGPELDPDYAMAFHAALRQHPWSRYLGTIPADAMAAAMQEADVIVNHSFQEGLPNALLEATVLGVPILARCIEGNAAVVDAGENGWLYREDTELCELALRLIDEPELCRRLGRPRPGAFRPEEEAAALQRLVCSVCG